MRYFLLSLSLLLIPFRLYATTITIDGVSYAQNDTGIQAAIADLPTAGGDIYIPAATYDLATFINVTKANITFYGDGATSILLLEGNANCSIFRATSSKANWTLRDFKADGNRTNQGSWTQGSFWETGWYADNCTFKNLTIVNMSKDGIRFNGCRNYLIENCTIDGIGTAGMNVVINGSGVYIASTNNVTVSNCTINDTLGSGVGGAADSGPTSAWNNNNITIQFNDIANVWGDQASGVMFWAIGSGVIKNNTIHDTNESAVKGVNFIFVRSVGGASVGTMNVTIQNNTGYNISGVGIELQGGSVYVYDNTIYFRNGSYAGNGTDANGIWFSNNVDGTEILVKGNKLYTPIRHGLYFSTGVKNAIVENNYFSNVQNNGSYIRVVSTGDILTNVTIRNNVFVENQGSVTNAWGIYANNGVAVSPYIYHNSFINIRNATNLMGGNWSIKNNIFNISGECQLKVANNATLDCDNNLFHPIANFTIGSTNYTTLSSWQSASSQDANSISADPLLASNYTLTDDSPAINNGTDVGVTSDYAGNPRPHGLAPDIGAYEFISWVNVSGVTIGGGVSIK